jgi:hypothetical protein
MNIQSGLNVEPRPRRAEPFPELVARLSALSVAKHYDAYQDVPWDEPGHRIDPDDERWTLPDDDPLANTSWYRAQPPAVRTRIGLHMAATFMKIGIQFESVLKRGLLEFAQALPNGAPEFRYAYHEVCEEAQHSLMFQEFVNRSGFDPPGLAAWRLWLGSAIARGARKFPSLFFVAVLAGEEPIDHVQRGLLHGDRPLPAVLERIMRIHVTEEARHLCFARQFLHREVPRLSRARRLRLQIRGPILLRNMATAMLCASPEVARMHGIPRNVMAEAYSRSNQRHAARMCAAVGKTRELFEELDLISPATHHLWRRLGLAAA